MSPSGTLVGVDGDSGEFLAEVDIVAVNRADVSREQESGIEVFLRIFIGELLDAFLVDDTGAHRKPAFLIVNPVEERSRGSLTLRSGAGPYGIGNLRREGSDKGETLIGVLIVDDANGVSRAIDSREDAENAFIVKFVFCHELVERHRRTNHCFVVLWFDCGFHVNVTGVAPHLLRQAGVSRVLPVAYTLSVQNPFSYTPVAHTSLSHFFVWVGVFIQ